MALLTLTAAAKPVDRATAQRVAANFWNAHRDNGVAAVTTMNVVALCSAENSSQQVIFIFAAFTCMAGLIVASLKLCRCPHCGKRILNGVLVKKICPNCRRSLTTGKRVKR